MDVVPCQQQRVLIVDDDDAIRKIMKQILLSDIPGLTVDVAINGMDAMKRFHAEHHAVVLIDLFMPVMNGEQAYRGIEQMCQREKWEMPAVVFCTAYNPSRELRNLVAMNPRHAMLQKPVKNDVLVEAIRSRLPPPAGSEAPPQSAADDQPAPPAAPA